MTFLTSVLVQIGEWFLTQIFAILQKDYAQYLADKKAAQDAKASQDTLDKAKTEAEIDKAASSTLNNL